MDFKVLITFGIGLAVYFVGLFIYVMIKRHRNKKAFDKEVRDKEDGKADGDKQD